MYTVIGQTRSRAFRVLWALQELGLAYDHVAAGPASDEAKGYHRDGKIPVLMVDDTPLTDSVAIMAFLADKHGALAATPGTIDRAHLDAMLHWLNERLDAPLWLMTRHAAILPEDKRVPAIIDSAQAEISEAMQVLAGRIQGPWLMGDAFTIADILAVHCLNWAGGVGLRIEDEGLKAYWKAARTRDAFRAAAQAD